MKRIILVFAFIFLFAINVEGKNDLQLEIDGKSQNLSKASLVVNGNKLKLEFSPYVSNGRTFVPIREIAESLGAEVIWNDKLKSASFSLDGKEVSLQINSQVVIIDGEKVKLESISIPKFATYNKPKNESKTMVPLRFLSETLGYYVDWDKDTLTAIISSDDPAKEKKFEEPEKNDDESIKNKKKIENIKVESLSDSEKASDSKTKNSNAFISNYEKKETNSINKNSEKEVYKAVGLNIDELDTSEKREIKKKIKCDGKLTIVLDAGHGGKDSGAVVESGLKEKTLTIDVVMKLYDKLLAKDYEVLLTRDRDEYIKLLDRAAKSNDNNAELFLSVHFNSSDNKKAKGIEVLYASEKKVKIKEHEQVHFAKELLKSLLDETGSSSRGIKNRPDLVVLNKTKNVSALVELGFMSNEEDYKNITREDYIDKLVEGLYKGINNYVDKYVEW